METRQFRPYFLSCHNGNGKYIGDWFLLTFLFSGTNIYFYLLPLYLELTLTIQAVGWGQAKVGDIHHCG